MRSLLLLLPVLVLSAQTPPTTGTKATFKKAAAPATPMAKNFKLSGNPTAPLTLELYTDYECPSCRMFYLQVLPAVIANYVTTGKIQLLHRDFPLPMHQFSKVAARYANAAGQIGRYDLVAGQIFNTQPDWAQNGSIDAQVAKVLPPGEMQKVRDLVKSDSHLDDTVTADVSMGNTDGLNQTPTMVFVYKGKRQRIDGALPYEILKSYIDQMLARG